MSIFKKINLKDVPLFNSDLVLHHLPKIQGVIPLTNIKDIDDIIYDYTYQINNHERLISNTTIRKKKKLCREINTRYKIFQFLKQSDFPDLKWIELLDFENTYRVIF